jgi:hypothetical protein
LAAERQKQMTTELTNYQLFQAERYGNILPEPIINPDGYCEAGMEEMERSAEWCLMQSELQLEQYQNQ